MSSAKLNLEHLKRNQIHKSQGVVHFEPEHITTLLKKQALRGFTEVPGYIPLEVNHDIERQKTTEEGKHCLLTSLCS